MALNLGVYGPRSYLAVNSLLELISHCFVGLNHEFKASIFCSKAKGTLGTHLCLHLEFTAQEMFLGRKLLKLNVLD